MASPLDPVPLTTARTSEKRSLKERGECCEPPRTQCLRCEPERSCDTGSQDLRGPNPPLLGRTRGVGAGGSGGFIIRYRLGSENELSAGGGACCNCTCASAEIQLDAAPPAQPSPSPRRVGGAPRDCLDDARGCGGIGAGGRGAGANGASLSFATCSFLGMSAAGGTASWLADDEPHPMSPQPAEDDRAPHADVNGALVQPPPPPRRGRGPCRGAR